MVTWAENLTRQGRSWIVYATIQGVGDNDGLWRFSSGTGWSLSAGQGSWRPWLRRMPDILSQRVPYVTGGVVRDSGSLTLELVDIGEALTGALQFDRGPAAYLATAATDVATSLTLDMTAAAAGISTGDIVYLGSEAVEVTNAVSSTLTVTRGALETSGRAHGATAPVYLSPAYLRHRRVRLYLAPLEGSESDAQLVGLYEVDDLSWSDDLTTWVLRASIAQGYLDRVVPRTPRETEVSLVNLSDGRLAVSVSNVSAVQPWAQDSTVRLQAPDGEGEIIEVSQGFFLTRAAYGTKRGELATDEGPLVFRVVLVGQVDFRFQEDGSTSTDRTDGNWTASDNWVDILLSLLLSPALEDGGADNYNTGGSGLEGRNYSGLPGGYGLGVPYTEVDWDSFETARATIDLRLPFLVIGAESEPFRDVFGPILRAAGAFLTQEAGLVRLVVPRLPTQADTASVTIDSSILLSSRNGLPRLSVSRPISDLLTTIRYVLGPQEIDKVVTWAADFARLFDPDDFFQLDGKSLELEVPGADPAEDGPWLRSGLRRLWAAYRPAVEVELDLDVGSGVWAWALAENATIDLPAIVDLSTGVRGLTGTAQLVEREPRIDPDLGVFIRARAQVQPGLRIGVIAPAADVTSVASAVATCAANRYTSTDAPTGYPTADAGSFTLGDVVQIMGADGTPLASGATETVDGISGNDLTLSGDFSGALASGVTIYTADADDQVSRQSSRYAALSTTPLWVYG